MTHDTYTYGTDNGPACRCAGTVYSYTITTGERPTMAARCIGCGRVEAMPAPPVAPIESPTGGAYIRKCHEARRSEGATRVLFAGATRGCDAR